MAQTILPWGTLCQLPNIGHLSSILYYTIHISYYTILYYSIHKVFFAQKQLCQLLNIGHLSLILILYYTALYYTLLYYTTLYYTHTILYFTVLFYNKVFFAPKPLCQLPNIGHISGNLYLSLSLIPNTICY